jgi:bifunctional DNA-binding transcriptional regulator/antitoxin component of YhaV-PrlF toxin-antitoxin module
MIPRRGQVSIPAPIRHRWATTTLTLEDQGDRIVLMPAPDDPIAAAQGALRESVAASLGVVTVALATER